METEFKNVPINNNICDKLFDKMINYINFNTSIESGIESNSYDKKK